MALHNSCAGNKPVITGGWGSGQAGRRGEGGQTCLPAPVLGFHPPLPQSPPPFFPLPLFIMQTRIASLLEVGLHFKGAPCLRSLPRPASQNPNTPKPGAPVAWAGRGETEEQRLVGAAPLGNPLRHHPNRIIRHPELSPPCFLQETTPASVYPLTTPLEPGDTGAPEPPARPPSSRLGHAAPRLTLR